jgi:hypothetical protein
MLEHCITIHELMFPMVMAFVIGGIVGAVTAAHLASNREE